MKKIILGISLLAIVGTVTFVACKKDSTNRSSNTLSSDLLFINQKHKFPSNLMSMTKEEKSARLAATIAADALGAGEGASVGAKVGTFLGGLAGTAFGAGFGAGIGGVAGSYFAWKSLTHDFSAPQGDDLLVEMRITNFNGVYSVSNPHSNPYEYVGVRHNELLTKLFLRNAALGSTTNIFLNFNVADLSTDEKALLISDTPQMFINSFNWVASNMPNNTAYIVRICGQDQTLNTILTSFVNGLNTIGITSAEEVMSYVNDYESYFIAYNGVSTDQRRILMCTFATAKHSAALWINAMNAIQ